MQGEAIAVNLREMFGFRVPILSVVIGEGGSGGALAIGRANRNLIMEHSVYYVASPEACAAILWKARDKAATVGLARLTHLIRPLAPARLSCVCSACPAHALKHADKKRWCVSDRPFSVCLVERWTRNSWCDPCTRHHAWCKQYVLHGPPDVAFYVSSKAHCIKDVL